MYVYIYIYKPAFPKKLITETLEPENNPDMTRKNWEIPSTTFLVALSITPNCEFVNGF